MTRRAEHEGARRWTGDVATANELDEIRTYVVWGEGYAPTEDLAGARAGNDVAAGVARAADEDWWQLPADRRWCVTLEADESEVDALVTEAGARGYAPYLVRGKDDELPTDGSYMRGTLRSDVGPRRKVDQPRPE